MGWFDEQMKQKMKNDEESFSDALSELMGAVSGKKNASFTGWDDRMAAIGAVHEILNYYHVKPQEIPDSLKELQDILEYLMRPSGFMRRKVTLRSDWYKTGVGAMLGTYQKSGRAVAILPAGGGYEAAEEETGEKIKITAANAAMFSSEAFCFYRPLPLKSIGIREFLAWLLQTVSAVDFAMTAAAGLLISLFTLLTSGVTQLIFSNVLITGNTRALVSCGILLTGSAASSAMISSVRELLMAKIRTKTDAAVSGAFFMRLLSLPTGFFKKYSAGELAGRMQDANGLCSMLAEFVLTVFLTAACSGVSFVWIAAYAAPLFLPVCAIMALTLLGSAVLALLGRKREESHMELAAKESGLVFSVFSGIQKMKLAGAEQRAFAKWAKQYGQSASLAYAPPWYIKFPTVFLTGMELIGTVLIYGVSIHFGIAAADYVAFSASYGMLAGGMFPLAASLCSFSKIRAAFLAVKPILEEVPEVEAEKKVVTRLSGGIELNHVSFRYREDMPMILNNLSLKIRPGQYVAVVGKTGCGKSTLLRLLLGFEQPMKGAVYFDGKDLSRLDLKSLRKFMGVVMQNGKLFQGDIFSNITIASPDVSMERAWEAAEIAGIADEIRRLPMGMHTIVSEGGAGFSGGQKQRILIARAVASKPKILLFDEATSALDNLTQKQVSDALSGMKCTRIVIAHRLSTILQCDRIVVMNDGQIAEDGTYEELIRKDGIFADLIRRQKVTV